MFSLWSVFNDGFALCRSGPSEVKQTCGRGSPGTDMFTLRFKTKKDVKKLKTNIFFYLILLTVSNCGAPSLPVPGPRKRAGMKVVPPVQSLQ